MEADFEKSSDDSRERSFMLVVALLIVSVVVHVALMLTVSGYSFTPMAEIGTAKGLRENVLRKVQVMKNDVDPEADAKCDVASPAQPPDPERQSDRVERLSGDVTGAVAPALPEPSAKLDSSDLPEVTPPAVPLAEWQPRQDILTVPEPVLPDEREARPRVVIPKVERVSHAADEVPAFDLIRSVETELAASASAAPAAPSVASGRRDDGTSAAAVAPAPPPSRVPAPGNGASDLSALTGIAATFSVSSAVEEEQRQREAAEAAAARKAGKTVEQMRAEEAAKAAKPPPAPPVTARVDEAVIAQEKEDVRRLRDKKTVAGRPFDQHVNVDLGFWVDPEQKANKYFRVRVASNADNPLSLVSKDIVFMLDASGSIGGDRLKSCREAVLEALDRLNTDDRFNVVAFRDKFTYAFTNTAWRAVDKDSVEEARKWMSTLKAHGNTDVFRTLRSVLALPRNPARPIVAFVATDGDATSGMTRSAEIISRFSDLNGGLVSIFMYGVKPDANAYLMDMLTRCNRGSWACHAAKRIRLFSPRDIPELSKKFEKPVLTDVAVLFTASSRAETCPKLVTNLCEDEPIEIYGVCPADQENLVFRMRGLNGVTSYESIFTLSFKSAKPLGRELRTAWATRRLYELIADYTRKPDAQLFANLHKFASDYGIKVPYERELKKNEERKMK